MNPDALDSLLRQTLAERERQSLLRRRRVLRALDSVHVEIDGRRYVNFASNNYLGLTHHPRVLDAAALAARRHGVGSGASPLVTGYTDEHAAAEADLAAWKGTESAVLLPSGYQASHAVVQTFASLGPPRFLLDKLAHASLIDAVRGTGAPYRVFPHNGLAKLERLLGDGDSGAPQVVLTESIFSMDGDPADLAGLAALRARKPFALVLDEAHGSGVYGEGGAGYAAEVGLQSAVDVSVVTLSKALGLVGGAVCASRLFCEGVVNLGRAYVYSTAPPAFVAAALREALAVLHDEPWRQRRVRQLARRVRDALGGPSASGGDSPIVPVVFGSEAAALAASRTLAERGLYAVAVRRPTVPRGTSRLRITLSCDHTDAEVDQLIEGIRACGVVLNRCK